MELNSSTVFSLPSEIIEDPSSDYSILSDWITECFTRNDLQKEGINVPLRIKNVIRIHDSFNFLIPILTRIIVRQNKLLPSNAGLEDTFNWINFNISRLNKMYELLKFNEVDMLPLRELEFVIYRTKVNQRWQLLVNLCFKSLKPEYFVTANSIGMYEQVNRLVYQIGIYHIEKTISDIVEEPLILTRMKSWIEIDLYEELQPLIHFEHDKDVLLKSLMNVLYSIIIKTRADNLFDIINEYPKSQATLQELNHCLSNNATQKDMIITNVMKQLNSKLLLPSVSTTDIIAFYTKTIKSFFVIDHRGVMLDKIARPIRTYLSTRPDTITKIVNALMDSNPKTNKLYQIHLELLNSSQTSIEPQFSIDARPFSQYLNWTPDPMETLPDFRVGKINDIIDSFISIFDDKGSFIDEFVKIFSSQLLQLQGSDYKEAIKDVKFKLDLLKRRLLSSNDFIGIEFNIVDIMIHDIELSNAIDTSIHNSDKNENLNNIHGVFLSHLYWPTLTKAIDSRLMEKMPPAIVESINGYSKQYQMRQKGRYLELHPDQSVAECEIEINGKTKLIKAKILDLCVLSWFMTDTKVENETWKPVKLGVIVMKLGMPLYTIKQALQFWKLQGILRESSGDWIINE